MGSSEKGWRFWVDRGGTFTDVVARDPSGELHLRKLLSEDPERYADAPLHAIRLLLGLAAEAPIPAELLAEVKMGTTLATNALLERRGRPTGLLITRGFADLLAIANQDRPDIFALEVRRPEPLVAAVEEVDERMMADGTVRLHLDERQARAALRRLRDRGLQAVAILLLHGFAYPQHELRLGELAREAGFTQVSLSHRVAREIKAVGRGDTTAADASLSPIIQDYVGRVRAALGAATPLWFARSSGGLAPADRFTGKDAVLSGPAGGVVACAEIARRAGCSKVIGFDMGGTSTDVSRWAGRFERCYEKRIAGVRLKAPMLQLETVAAGGGSILTFDGQRYQVGPRSAGANPGPACYRKGGPATVTDANLVLGRIQPRWFPTCFGSTGDQPLDPDAARERLSALATSGRTVEQVAAGCLRIANEHMVTAIQEISVARGHDPAEHALVCFGGAGAQHACALAAALGIGTVLIPPLAGVLSAWGIGRAEASYSAVEPVLEILSPSLLRALQPRIRRLEQAGAQRMAAAGFDAQRVVQRPSLELRYLGVDATLDLPLGPELQRRFEAAHQARYGYLQPDQPVEVVNLRLETAGLGERTRERPQALEHRQLGPEQAIATRWVHFEGLGDDGRRQLTRLDTPVYQRDTLRPGHQLLGPALLVEPISTVVVDPGWSAEVDGWGQLHLRARASGPRRERVGTACDPVLLEVFNNLFGSIADRMGATLERVAHSVNIKERLDFSCAVFDGQGRLVANAQHIPVHLGAMGASVRAIIEGSGGALSRGDVYASNDPYHGGSHLPDVTVVSPVFIEEQLEFFVASRGHHADIGGRSPGSMPPDARTLHEEGVVLHCLRLVSAGRFQEAQVRAALSSGPWPARNLPERLSDLRAQVAANHSGARLLTELCEHYGSSTVRAYMDHVRDNAAAAMRRLLARLPDGEHSYADRLDSGARIACRVTVQGEHCAVDFSGTSPQLPGNLNAPAAVTTAAVLYAFHTLVHESVPLNDGCLEPISIRVPPGCLLDPRPPAAVAAGNVETSMRVVEVLLAALGALSAGQGTMNNLLFGAADWGYYETICGGTGAGRGFHGEHAVHSHMTNTRITDPEVLERRYPVLLRRFAIRRGSGGAGRWRGGDGAVRELEFLEPLQLTMITERRSSRPFGLRGGEPGMAGGNTLISADGAEHALPGRFSVEVRAGDALRIETPGGGGYGPQPRIK